ncbi:16S rRNA (cytosine(1402)-N(4))-methyltransferase RsmH [Thalassobaculum litoreum]|uniref:Ribosomal RNA small subunit methyltransferase H n=1 Tax=Thalassobaculum litoreum DSM 18839 TaxID=1123362 RepID=A0A8G2BIV1_9PROT|nr:16S rRNA (cytosine(1402)-N(4))-methyltransferase RsmH [Thalassobaculum litoreum]SDF86301.1 16S rRNA (cytosine1402-N4)-methyltransferase [Thalassobaculum litoreum DSM 18839]
MNGSLHISVLLAEVVTALAPKAGDCHLDGTFGVGGYTRAILEAADCTVLAVDRDPDAIARAQTLAQDFLAPENGGPNGSRLIPLHGRFGEMDSLARAAGYPNVDGVTLDLGVSSPQLDEAERGFSFRFDGPLDMRMERDGPTAADVVNEASEKELADIIFHLGEERYARRVAKAIVTARTTTPIRRTGELAELVRRVVPSAPAGSSSRGNIDSATRTFQALRIHVNRELEELDQGLDAAERLLAPGGRLAVVSFHSLEDRRVKTFLRQRSGRTANPSRHTPDAIAGKRAERAPTFTLTSTRPIAPSEEEIARNPRARSARLRVGHRTDAPAWTGQEAA